MSSTRSLKFARMAAAAGLIVGLAGCGEDVEPLGEGNLTLTWEVSPHGCESAEVDTVEVRLGNAHRNFADAYACEEGEALLGDLAPANYKLQIVGLDATGRETFASQPRMVTISPEKLNEGPHVRLTAKPASLEVAWRFGNSRVCGANGVSRVEVALYDTAYYELARDTFRCDAGSGTIEELIAGDYIVEAIAEGDEGGVFRGISEAKLKRGDEGYADVELQEQ